MAPEFIMKKLKLSTAKRIRKHKKLDVMLTLLVLTRPQLNQMGEVLGKDEKLSPFLS